MGNPLFCIFFKILKNVQDVRSPLSSCGVQEAIFLLSCTKWIKMLACLFYVLKDEKRKREELQRKQNEKRAKEEQERREKANKERELAERLEKERQVRSWVSIRA